MNDQQLSAEADPSADPADGDAPGLSDERARPREAGGWRLPRQSLLLSMGAVLGAVAAVGLMAFLTSGGNPDAADATVATTAASPLAAEGGTAPGPTAATTTSTTTAPRPEDTFDEAVQAWAGVSATAEHAAGPAAVNGIPFAASATGAAASVWRWDGRQWSSTAELYLNDGQSVLGVFGLSMGDATGDGSAEIAVTYIPGNDAVGEVFRFTPDGVWRSAAVDHSAVGMDWSDLEVPWIADGRLTSTYNSCWPSCADGARLEIRYDWRGDTFVATSRACESYRAPRSRSDEYGICDSGDYVVMVQEALKHFGYLKGAVDGNFGPGTEAAVEQMQYNWGYPATGTLVGEQFYVLVEGYHAELYGDEYYG